MKNINPYSPEWFAKQKIDSAISAGVILPIVIDLISPKSVVDIGCGVGVWLESFIKQGITDVLGIDGKWVDQSQLAIPVTSFRSEDINQPFKVGKKADLAMSLEVGEHLPDSSADTLVASLVGTAPVVLFSSAIPGQPGTAHINCQWPEYWANIFKKYGYIPVDCIRWRVWTNPKVQYWYAQNMFLYVKESELVRYPKLQKELAGGRPQTLPLVHPTRYQYALKPLPTIIFRIKRKIKSLSSFFGF